jgi:hypothetical protein
MDIQKHEAFTFSFGTFVWWVGVVEDRMDPKKLGRLRVRAMGYHTDDKALIPSEKLFWANLMQPTTSSAMNGIGTSPTGIVEGTWCIGFFRDGLDNQDPIIMGTIGGIPEERDPSKGFFDPNDVYPKDDFMKEPDTNRLARNEKIDETIVQDKKDNRDTEIPIALKKDGAKWDEPEVPDARAYPYNHVRETETGHVEEWDDTEGEERFHRYHRMGTFVEEHKNGDQVRHVHRKKYEIIHDDNHIHIKGKGHVLNITVDGNSNFYVKGDSNIETAGNHNEWVHGNYNLKVDGAYNLQCASQVWINGLRIDLNSGNAPQHNFY